MKMKKLLASALAAAMVVSSMIGTMVTSAATSVGTITAGTVNAVVGETDTVTADINIAFTEGVVAPHNIITVALDGYTLSDVTLGGVTYTSDTEGVVSIDADGSNLAAGKILLECPVDATAPTVTAIALTATFVDADDVDTEAGTYAIVVSGDDMTDVNESDIAITAVNGSLVVAEPHVCSAGEVTPNNDGTHDIACAGCELLFADNEPCTYVDGACSVCGYAEPVTGPVLDETITLTTAINVTETINTRVIISKEVANYADYDLVLSRAKAYNNSGAYDLTEVQEFVYDKGEEITVMSDGRGAFLYNDLGMYELGIDFTIMIKCYDADGNYVAYSNAVTTNIGKLAYALYSPANASAKNKNIAIDIAKLGDEAQKYMVNSKDCGLATVTSPISYFPADATEGATFDASTLNTTNNSESVVTGVTITPAVNLAGNPCLRYMVAGTGTTYAQDTLSLEISYINGKNGKDCSVTIAGADLQVVGTAGTASVRYANLFGAIALYDGNVTVTATLKSGDTVLATNEYSVESYVSGYYTNARMGAVLQAVANLGTSARAYFGM